MRYLIGLVALLSACSPKLPTAPAPLPQPTAGVPSSVHLSVSTGFGPTAGTATVSATVMDAYSAPVVGATVTFTSAPGSIESPVITNEKGIAASKVTAEPGAVQVTVHTGSVEAKTLVALQAPPVEPPNTPSLPPPPPPPPLPIPPSYRVTITAAPTTVTAGGTVVLTGTATALNGAPSTFTWSWDCGDGSAQQSTPGTASCTYLTAGTPRPSVSVRNGDVSGNASTTVTVNAAPVPVPPVVPVVTVVCSPGTHMGTLPTATPVDCFANAKINGAPAAITSATWVWGDNQTTANATAHEFHQYALALADPDRYPVTVTATVTGTTAVGIGTAAAVVH